jgi:hypothetical protein
MAQMYLAEDNVLQGWGTRVLIFDSKTRENRRRRRETRGTAVAHCRGMRPMFLAWLTVALLLLGIGRLTHAGNQLEVAGFVNATAQEADEGYFAVGNDAMIVVKQGSGLQRWLKTHSGQRVRLALAVDGAE